MHKWTGTAGVVSSVILSFLFLASGLWKLSDLDGTAERMIQSLIPQVVSMPVAMAVAAFETFTGVLLLIPRFRRWGAWLAAAMLVAFMLYIGILYDRLLGDDCNCFPWIKRVVGPAFFAGDAAMLVLAMAAAKWSARSWGVRPAALVLSAICAVTVSSDGVALVRREQIQTPRMITVDGKTFRLREGRVLLYFFDPECSHCFEVAAQMGKQRWNSTRVIVVPTREPRFTESFLGDAKLKASVSEDAGVLRAAFPFTDPPYAVALDDGDVEATFNSGQLEGESYYGALRRLGHVE